jgi:hypothetical protein
MSALRILKVVMLKQEVQGPTKERYLKSYEKRRAYKEAIQYPPEVPGVKDAVATNSGP